MPQNIILPSRPHTCHRAMACVMASAVATPAVSRVPKFNRVFTQRSTLTGRGTRTERTRGRQLGTVICRSTKFSEQFGDAGAPKPGTLQSPPLYVKRTVREGQTVRHPGTIIVSALITNSVVTGTGRPPNAAPDATATNRRRHPQTVDRRERFFHF